MGINGSLGTVLQGVSQQQPRVRLPGQVTEQINIHSDVVKGAVSRPPVLEIKVIGTEAVAMKFDDIEIWTKRVDMGSFRRNFTAERTALVVINSPGNPIGNIVTPDEMREIYETVDGQAYILNDEIYHNTMFYDDFHSPLALFPEHGETTIVTNSFSKGYRMYTKRVGFAILPQELQVNLRVIQQHTLLCTDPVYQYGMLAALEAEASPADRPSAYPAAAQAPLARGEPRQSGAARSRCSSRPRGGSPATLTTRSRFRSTTT